MRTTWIIGAVLSAGVTLDLLSIIAWSAPAWSGAIAAAVIAAVAILAFIDIRLGVAAVFLELLWGSHGYLLRIPWQGIDLSLRMGLFLVLIAATVWRLRTSHARQAFWEAVRRHPVRWPAFTFLATLVLGALLGFVRHPFDRAFFDANTWAFLLLAPSFLLASQSRIRGFHHGFADTRILESVFLSGAAYLIARTYVLLFLFSHDLGGFWLAAYQWVRDTRLGEVTIFPGAFPRVFLPSMVLLFPALLLAAGRMRQRVFSPARGEGELEGVGSRMLAAAVFGGGVAVLLLSLSRSYWVGLAVLCTIGLAWGEWERLPTKKHSHILENVRMSWGGILRSLVAVVAALLLAVAVVRLPYPTPLTTAGIGNTLLARLSADAAVSNRWQQIDPLREAIIRHPIFGSGFGAAVTYETKDPRTLAAYPDGKYTTTAFEWGYLDDLLERGIVGLLAELWLIGALIWHGLRKTFSPPLAEGEREGVVSALALGLLAIAIVHATSPYLNHPLGIGVVLWLFAMEAPRPPVRGAVATR